MHRTLERLRRLLVELKRRKVYRVAVGYLVAAFVVLQLAGLAAGAFGFPGWFEPMIWVVAALCFPIAVVLAWAFEVTPDGVRRVSRDRAGEADVEPADAARAGSTLLLALGLLAAAAAGSWYLVGGGGTGGGDGSEAAVRERSIAVLPFDNLSGSEEARPFVNGIHDDLLTRLSSVAELKVISRTSVLPFRTTSLSLPAIADSLGVRWIVEGGVQQAGDRVRVNAQLIDARADAHRWAESYERELTTENIFAIQSELTKRIARSLEAQLTTRERRRVEREPTGDLTAYRLYIQGRNLLDRRTGESMREALGYFRRALERDSTYAVAWAGLADATGLLHEYGYGVPEGVYGQGEAARRALELDPDLAEAHASLAHHLFTSNRGAAALRHLRRAAELRPSYAQAHHWLGWLLPPLGRLEEGLEHASLAVELNPRHSAAAMVLGEALVASGRAEAALAEVRRVRRTHPTYSAAPMNEALALFHLGRYEEARAVASEGLPGARDYAPRARTLLAAAAEAAGDSSAARRRIEGMREAGDPPAFVGLALAAAGETEAAFAAFREEGAWPGWATTGLRYWFPERLAPLRRDARYPGLLRRVNEGWGLNPDGSVPDSVAS